MTTEPHEPSYYEIALTNRQVVTAFVILLACLLAAFLSGVWVGRGGMGPAEEEAQAAAPAGPREAAALEEFEFFSEDDEAGAPAAEEGSAARVETPPAAPPPAAPPRTLREELEAVAPPGDESAALEPEEGAAADAGEEVASAEPERPPAAPREESAAPAAPDTARTPPGTVVIQVFSSAEQDQATRVRDRLVASGYKAFLSPVDVSGRTMYRVRIGPFTSRDKAQEVAERVRRTHRLDTWVTQ